MSDVGYASSCMTGGLPIVAAYLGLLQAPTLSLLESDCSSLGLGIATPRFQSNAQSDILLLFRNLPTSVSTQRLLQTPVINIDVGIVAHDLIMSLWRSQIVIIILYASRPK